MKQVKAAKNKQKSGLKNYESKKQTNLSENIILKNTAKNEAKTTQKSKQICVENNR